MHRPRETCSNHRSLEGGEGLLALRRKTVNQSGMYFLCLDFTALSMLIWPLALSACVVPGAPFSKV